MSSCSAAVDVQFAFGFCVGGWDSLPKPQAQASGCINWATPDQFGHYREAKIVATKHHWFWQFNFVFQQLRVANKAAWTGYALYLEEDNFVAPDILIVLEQMIIITHNQVPHSSPYIYVLIYAELVTMTHISSTAHQYCVVAQYATRLRCCRFSVR
jgi:hypothetical protein